MKCINCGLTIDDSPPSGESADQRVRHSGLSTLPVYEPVAVETTAASPSEPIVLRLKCAFRPAPCGCDFIRVNGVLQRRRVCDEHRAELGGDIL